MKERERETTPAEMKICYGQLTRTENSQKQILELKRTTTKANQPQLYKWKGTQWKILLLHEDSIKR